MLHLLLLEDLVGVWSLFEGHVVGGEVLDAEGVGYDLATHRASPPGIRIWTGATVERGDVEALLPWLDWAWEQERDTAKAG